MSGVSERDFGSREDAVITDLELAGPGATTDTHTAMGLFKGMVQQLGDALDALEAMPSRADLTALFGKAGYETDALAGNVLMATNVGAQAVSVALTATYTGLCISNPIGSGVDLVMLGCRYALTVAPAAIASLHLIGGFSSTVNVAHTTPLAAPGIFSSKIGTAAATAAKADTAATTVNPQYIMPLGSGFTAAALYADTPGWIDLRGLVVVPPGGWLAWGALTAVTGFGGFAWKEVTATP